jgi:hypothetical protein
MTMMKQEAENIDFFGYRNSDDILEIDEEGSCGSGWQSLALLNLVKEGNDTYTAQRSR